ncbi:MAG: hypothetical protein JRG99_04340 [Deltaproteobacteria bacterium]|nr:hypothetical protein [Deltaproteobacteria bacterium]MBW2226538.1 hypothetical protein [Deltaproteobacteria bacterium]
MFQKSKMLQIQDAEGEAVVFTANLRQHWRCGILGIPMGQITWLFSLCS